MVAHAEPVVIDIEGDGSAQLSDPTSMSPRHASPRLSRANWANLIAYVLNSVVTYTSLTGIFGATNTELSAKYQTLVTPAGWAFSIWGPIFLWEGVFAVAQIVPKFRNSQIAIVASPWWCAASLCQIGWTFAFAQEVIPLSLALMIGILVALIGATRACSKIPTTWLEWALLRAPFSLHLGWIIVASVVNTNVQVVASTSSERTLLAASILSFCFVAVVSYAASIGEVTGSYEPIVCIVVAWACAAIASELREPDTIIDTQWLPHERLGLADAASGVCVLSIILVIIAFARGFWSGQQVNSKESTVVQ